MSTSNIASRRGHPSQRRYAPEVQERAVRMVREALRESSRSHGVVTGWRVSWVWTRRPCGNGSGKLRLTTASDRE